MDGKHYRNSWLDFTAEWSQPALKLTLGSYDEDDNRAQLQVYPGWGKFFFRLPFRVKDYGVFDEPEYGVAYHDHGLWWHWGQKHWCWRMPWDMDWVRTSRLLPDTQWEVELKGQRLKVDPWDQPVGYYWLRRHPYTYTLQSGEKQRCMATIKVEEREWRPRWFRWTALFAKVRRTIAVEFEEELGERSPQGSRPNWKGGVVGCSWDMLPGESFLQCLRRMEIERKFN